jgi:hypothetical protein
MILATTRAAADMLAGFEAEADAYLVGMCILLGQCLRATLYAAGGPRCVAAAIC